jgi:death-on-curing protein
VPEPNFLTLAEVEHLHAESLARWGGLVGVRDPGLVDAALASAINSWHYGSADLFEVAATFAFHLAESQAFMDGNKRTGAAAALVFLAKNELPVLVDDGTIYNALIAVASKQMNKTDLAGVLRRLAKA